MSAPPRTRRSHRLDQTLRRLHRVEDEVGSIASSSVERAPAAACPGRRRRRVDDALHQRLQQLDAAQQVAGQRERIRFRVDRVVARQALSPAAAGRSRPPTSPVGDAWCPDARRCAARERRHPRSVACGSCPASRAAVPMPRLRDLLVAVAHHPEGVLVEAEPDVQAVLVDAAVARRVPMRPCRPGASSSRRRDLVTAAASTVARRRRGLRSRHRRSRPATCRRIPFSFAGRECSVPRMFSLQLTDLRPAPPRHDQKAYRKSKEMVLTTVLHVAVDAHGGGERCASKNVRVNAMLVSRKNT